MKVYVTKKDEKRKYIKDVKECSDGTLQITFADGRKFKNIEKSEDNIARINDVQEQQAKKGLMNYVTFKNRFYKAILYLGCSGFATGLVLAAAVAYPQMTPLELFTELGVINVFGVLPSVYKLVKNKVKIAELDKIEYRDANIEKLKKYKSYENSLAGLNSSTGSYFDENSADKAFSVVNADNYTKKDLKTIISNIDNEESLGFTYVKKKPENSQSEK